MIKEEELWIESEIEKYQQNLLKEITNRIKDIWKETIELEVYSKYEPKWYNRTYQLKESITSKIEGNILYVYADIDNMQYFSFGDKDKPVNPDFILHILDVGHDTVAPYEGKQNMFTHYPARHFIQSFGERVQKEFPDLKIEIVRDTPTNIYL